MTGESSPDRRPLGLHARSNGDAAPTWDAFRCGIVIWIVILVTIAISSFVGDDEAPSAQAIILMDCLMAAITIVGAATVFQDVRPLFLRFGGLEAVAWALAAFAAIGAFMFVYVFVATSIGFRYANTIEEYGATGWPLWGVLISVAAFPAVFEEILFRGVVQTGMEQVMNRRDALIVQAAMFSVLHLSPIVFISHFGMGLALGYVRRRSGSLYPGMLVHGAWNAWVAMKDWASV